jgi:hypothetical protein
MMDAGRGWRWKGVAVFVSLLCAAIVGITQLQFAFWKNRVSEPLDGRRLRERHARQHRHVDMVGVSSLNNVRAEYLGFYRDTLLNLQYNYHKDYMDGKQILPNSPAVTMIGQRRLDNFAALAAMVIEDGVSGHVIETGVWRGGSAFMAAKTIEILGETSNRRVYLADSFQGIPQAPTNQMTSLADNLAETLSDLGTGSRTKVIGDATKEESVAYTLSDVNGGTVDKVMRYAASFGLDENHLRWIVGYFNESLPKLFSDEPDLRFSVIRLDGDTYFSTMDAIRELYPRLNPGGFIIIDDFTDWIGCMTAIRHYRKKNGISEPIILVPHKSGEVLRGVYWRKGPLRTHMSECSAPVSSTSLRPKGSYCPGKLVDMPKGGPPDIDVGLIMKYDIPDIKMCID